MTDSNLYSNLRKKLNSLGVDIGIVVNNVGLLNKNFEQASVQKTIDMNIVNTLPQVGVNQIFLEDLQKDRVFKSAIIDVSSLAALEVKNGDFFHYSASKRFNQIFTQGKAMSNSEGIDWLILRPGMVNTPMLANKSIDLVTCTASECVDGVLRCLGKVDMIYGSRKHEIIHYFLELGYLFLGVYITRLIIYDTIAKVWNFFFVSQKKIE